jgi:diacylglycerol kinase family enzyme
VGPSAPAELEAIFAELGIPANISVPAPEDLEAALRSSIDAAPDLLVVLAGDGTARAAAELCGPDGPLLAPLAGGTMNMLPHALYGAQPWPQALRQVLEHGAPRTVGGGEVEGHRFLVGAILGAPALWAPAREAARHGKLRLAWIRGQRAFRRAFTGRLRYTFDGGDRQKAEALVLMCPLASKVMHEDEPALEAAALNIHGAAEALRLGVNAIIRDWRVDPAVEDEFCRVVRVWSAHSIPALLDGESVRLRPLTEVRYEPAICRVLALPREAP